MARLCGEPVGELQADRLGVAERFAREHGVVVVLKGARTVVGALLAQRMEPRDAARAGAYLHGLAGDLAARRHGERGLVASDLGEALGEVWAAWRL